MGDNASARGYFIRLKSLVRTRTHTHAHDGEGRKNEGFCQKFQYCSSKGKQKALQALNYQQLAGFFL